MSETIDVACPHCRAVNRTPAARLAEKPACGSCHQPLFTGVPMDLDEAGFELHAMRSGLPLLVVFRAPWCSPCAQMASHFESAALELEPLVRLGRLDVDAVQMLASHYAIRSIPTLVMFRGGAEVARLKGSRRAVEITHFARQHL